MTFRQFAIALAMLLMPAAMAQAGEQLFSKPQLGNYRLDYCYSWQQGCGQKAASAWCEKKGFDKAESFKKAKGIGEDTPTKTVGDGSVCDSAKCDGFSSILCTSAADYSFYKPKISGVRLDWCYAWQKKCGKPAADAFCKKKGFSASSTFQREEGVDKTKVISTGQTCEGGQCDGFMNIGCQD